jgi:integrase
MNGKSRQIQTNIYKRVHESGYTVWMVRWKNTVTGKWRARTAGKSQDEAMIVEAKVRQDLALGNEPFPEIAPLDAPLTVIQVIDLFYKSPKFLTGKPLWQSQYKLAINRDVIPLLGKKKFTGLSKDTVIKFYLSLKKRGLANASIQKYHALLCHLGDTFSDKTGQENPVRLVRNFKKFFPNQASSRDINFLTPEELQTLFQATETSPCWILNSFVRFLAHTGLRRAEALGLRWTDIDRASGFIHVRNSKSGQARMVPLEAGALDALDELNRKREFVFTKLDGGRYNERYMLKPLKRAAIEAGITKRIDLHTLRHSYGSNKIRAGWGLKKVSMILGHADIKITAKVYTHLLDGDLKIRDEFTFDNVSRSANDGSLKGSEMSALLGETISRLGSVSEASLKESLRHLLAEMSPARLRELAQPSLADSELSPDSTTTEKNPLHVTPVLRAPLEAGTPKSKSPQARGPEGFLLTDISEHFPLGKWRLHGDSNPGYSRERGVS